MNNNGTHYPRSSILLDDLKIAPKQSKSKPESDADNGLIVSWSYDIEYTRPNEKGKIGNTNGGADTLEETIQRLFMDGSYYLGLGYSNIKGSITCNCRKCQGRGKISKIVKKFPSLVKCDKCKGQGNLMVIGPINITIPNNVEIKTE